MVSRKALTTVGPLDEIFFAYGEDKDWGWRARMRGFHSLYVPSSRIYHKGSSVLGWTPRKLYYLELERLVSIWKNHSKRALILLAPLLAITEIAVLTHAMRRRWLSSKIDSYVHAFALRREISKGRSEVFAKKVIPDDVLLREFLYDLWHPYIGRVLIPLNRICRLYKRCIISP
jgi:GT2 family glycosyltransferase